MQRCFAAYFAISLLCVFSSGQEPGLKIKVNSRGLHLVKQVALGFMKEKLGEAIIPDVIGQEVGVSFNAYNIKLNSFNLGITNVRTRAPNIFIPSISRGSVFLSANWKATRKIQLVFLKKTFHFRGRLTGAASGISLSQQVIVGSDSSGRPTFTPGTCRARINFFSARVSGTRNYFIVNTLIQIFGGKIKSAIHNKICPLLTETIKRHGELLTRSFNPVFPFDSGIKINLGLVRSPEADSNCFIASVVGRCFSPQKNPKQLFTFQPTPLPVLHSTTKMAQFEINSYVLNTLLLSFWQNLRFTKTYQQSEIAMIIGLSSNLLVATDDSVAGLGRFVGVFSYLNSSTVEIVIKAPSAPTAEISNSGISVSGMFLANVNTRRNPLSDRFKLAASVLFNVTVLATVSLSNDYAKTNIIGLTASADPDHDLPNNVISVISALLLDFIPSILRPGISRLTGSGFKIPEFFGFRPVSQIVDLKKDTLDVACDFTTLLQ